MVSNKLSERFRNLREAFRYIDTDHSSSISLNEFAQAIDFFRLKLSFKDITTLFRFLDVNGNGTIGFEEFINLSETNWSKMNPFTQMNENLKKRNEIMANQSSSEPIDDHDPEPKELGKESLIAGKF